jgi:hypothetical protein
MLLQKVVKLFFDNISKSVNWKLIAEFIKIQMLNMLFMMLYLNLKL